jgi:hypothetical protein
MPFYGQLSGVLPRLRHNIVQHKLLLTFDSSASANANCAPQHLQEYDRPSRYSMKIRPMATKRLCCSASARCLLSLGDKRTATITEPKSMIYSNFADCGAASCRRSHRFATTLANGVASKCGMFLPRWGLKHASWSTYTPVCG